jgi:hypothetical protein
LSRDDLAVCLPLVLFDEGDEDSEFDDEDDVTEFRGGLRLRWL